jgi:transposase
VNEQGTSLFEKLQPANMVCNRSLALSISDAGWGQFVQFAMDKTERNAA